MLNQLELQGYIFMTSQHSALLNTSVLACMSYMPVGLLDKKKLLYRPKLIKNTNVHACVSGASNELLPLPNGKHPLDVSVVSSVT